MTTATKTVSALLPAASIRTMRNSEGREFVRAEFPTETAAREALSTLARAPECKGWKTYRRNGFTFCRHVVYSSTGTPTTLGWYFGVRPA